MESDVTECVNLINDMRICPKCHGELRYEYRRYHHIGKAVCDGCGFCSPKYDYFAEDVDFHNMTMRFSASEKTVEYPLLSDSLFNVYNMVTVAEVEKLAGGDGSGRIQR